MYLFFMMCARGFGRGPQATKARYVGVSNDELHGAYKPLSRSAAAPLCAPARAFRHACVCVCVRVCACACARATDRVCPGGCDFFHTRPHVRVSVCRQYNVCYYGIACVLLHAPVAAHVSV